MSDDVNGGCRICRTKALFPFVSVNGKAGQCNSPDAWDRMGPNGTEWDRMGPNGTEWDRMGPNGTEWDRMDVSVAEFRPLCLLRPGQCLLPSVGT